MQLPFFQQRQLEHAQNVLTRSVSNHAYTTPYPASEKEIKVVEERFKQAYKNILKLSRQQAQWLAKKNYSNAEKTKILILLGKRNASQTATNKNVQLALTHLTAKTR